MANIDSDSAFESPYMYYPFMTYSDSNQYEKPYRLHATLAHAKTSIKGRSRDSNRRIYQWVPDDMKWLCTYSFMPRQFVKF